MRDKFRRNAKARGVLVGTGRVKLVYANTHEDRVWGVCGGKGQPPFVPRQYLHVLKSSPPLLLWVLWLSLPLLSFWRSGLCRFYITAAKRRPTSRPKNVDGVCVSWPWGRRRVA